MSYVTSVVVAAPFEDPELVRELGERMYAAHARARGWETGPDNEAYWPPLDYESATGGKYPSGSLWWLGLNSARMDDFVEALRDERFAGTTVWWQSEDDDQPHTETISGGGR